MLLTLFLRATHVHHLLASFNITEDYIIIPISHVNTDVWSFKVIGLNPYC